MKYSISLLVSLVLAYFLPIQIITIIKPLSNLLINFSYYFLYPSLFFSIVLGINEYKKDNKLFRILIRIFIYLILVSLSSMILIVFFIQIFPVSRVFIPINDNIQRVTLDSFEQVLSSLFSKNLLTSLSSIYLLPLVFFAIIFGYFLKEESSYSNVVMDFCTSINKIFLAINKRVVFIISFLIAFVSIDFVLTLRSETNLQSIQDFQVLIYFSLFIAILMIFIICPLIYFVIKRSNPITWIKGALNAILSSLISGDSIFSLNIALDDSKKSFYYKRESASINYSLAFIFSKAGTIMIGMLAFSSIVNTYTIIEISFLNYLWVGILALLVSLSIALTSKKDQILYFSVFVTQVFANGFENTYSIIVSISLLLGYIASAIDTAFAVLIASLIDTEESY